MERSKSFEDFIIELPARIDKTSVLQTQCLLRIESEGRLHFIDVGDLNRLHPIQHKLKTMIETTFNHSLS